MIGQPSIVDTHLLLADTERFEMPWFGEGYFDDSGGRLHRHFGPADYLEAVGTIPINQAVYMQAGVDPAYGYLEATWAAGALRADLPWIDGIVAWAPIHFGDRVAAYLEELSKIGDVIKGCRRDLELEEPDFCLQPAFVNGIRRLAEFNLSFDIAAKRWQLPSVIRLVEQCPDVQFMVDHFAKPDPSDPSRDDWATNIAVLGQFENVYCKLSGLMTEGDSSPVTGSQIASCVAIVLDAFGPSRLVFGSDWPVVNLTSSLRQWAEFIAAILSEPDQEGVWQENAARFYRLTARSGRARE